MLIRNSKKEDIQFIVKLVGQMVDYHKFIDKYYKAYFGYNDKEIMDHFERLMKDENTKIIIAEENKRIIGYFMGAIEKAPSYVLPKEIGVIFDAFIEKEYRNKGVGKKIFKELLEWFKKKKVKHIELTVDARNKIGLKSWRKFGFFDFRLKMRLDL